MLCWIVRDTSINNYCTSTGIGNTHCVLTAFCNIHEYSVPQIVFVIHCTSSSAVAEKPRDASCLSVVSFNIVHYVERSLLLLVTSASNLPLRTNKFCSVLFIVVVHAGCDEQRFSDVWRSVCGKLHEGRSQLLFALHHSLIRQPDIRRESDFCIPHLHSTPMLGGSSLEYCHDVWYNTRSVATRRWNNFEDMIRYSVFNVQ